MTKIIGTSFVPRTITDLWSLDRAFHNKKIGIPAFGMWEGFGGEHVGKSTFFYSLAAILAEKWDCNVSIADIEGLDEEFVKDIFDSYGFNNCVRLIQEISDEKVMETLLGLFEDEYEDKPTHIGIFDSIGAISPHQELDGDIGDANMGRRAFIMSQFSRKFTKLILGKNDKVLFMTNHVHQNLGRFAGTHTPGGATIGYLAGVRIKLFQKAGYPTNQDTSIGYLLQGQVVKNRYGGKGKKFQVFVNSGLGISKNITAIFDCIEQKLAKVKRTVYIGDESFGFMKNMIEKDREGDNEFFNPFHELLSNHLENTTKSEDIDDEDEEDDNRD